MFNCVTDFPLILHNLQSWEQTSEEQGDFYFNKQMNI